MSNPFRIPAGIKAANPPQSNTVQIINIGADPIWVGHAMSLAPDFRSVLDSRVELKNGDSIEVTGWTYIWKSLSGVIQLEMILVGDNAPKPEIQTIPTDCGAPNAAFMGLAGETYVVNMDSPTPILLSNDMTKFLGDLLHTTSFDKGANSWPEDSYPDGSALRKACTYIETEIAKLHPNPIHPDPNPQPIKVKNGTVSKEVLDSVTTPDATFYANNPNIGFTAKDFGAVMSDLSDEIDKLTYLNGWYGPEGILNFVNLQMAAANTANIGAVQNALAMQSDQSVNVDAVFSVIMGDLLDAVSLVPGVGSPFAAVMNIALSMGTFLNGQPANTQNQIDSEVSTLYNQVVKTLAAFTSLNAQSYAWIKADYGRISAFQNAVINGVVSFDGVNTAGTTPENYSTSGPGRDYITAMQNGWQKWYFKQLYFITHGNTVSIAYVSEDGFEQGWDPNNGKMTFNFRLPCTRRDMDNNTISDFLKFSMIPGASALANDMMFRTDMLTIDPLTFFLGVNGWRWTPPQYTNPYGREPILTIG